MKKGKPEKRPGAGDTEAPSKNRPAAERKKWTLESVDDFRGYYLYFYSTDKDYTAAMLVSDLLEAGISVSEVSYEESEADVGMKYYGGSFAPDVFISVYDSIRKHGWGGMIYSICCDYRGDKFEMMTSNDEHGNPRGKVSISYKQGISITGEEIAALLSKGA